MKSSDRVPPRTGSELHTLEGPPSAGLLPLRCLRYGQRSLVLEHPGGQSDGGNVRLDVVDDGFQHDRAGYASPLCQIVDYVLARFFDCPAKTDGIDPCTFGKSASCHETHLTMYVCVSLGVTRPTVRSLSMRFQLAGVSPRVSERVQALYSAWRALRVPLNT